MPCTTTITIIFFTKTLIVYKTLICISLVFSIQKDIRHHVRSWNNSFIIFKYAYVITWLYDKLPISLTTAYHFNSYDKIKIKDSLSSIFLFVFKMLGWFSLSCLTFILAVSESFQYKKKYRIGSNNHPWYLYKGKSFWVGVYQINKKIKTQKVSAK